MTQRNALQIQRTQPDLVIKSILIGATIGLILISFFVFGGGAPNPAWGKLWMVKPLIFVPVAGALGGLFYYFMNQLNLRGGLHKTVVLILSLIVFIILLWLGTVLGLNGTMWD